LLAKEKSYVFQYNSITLLFQEAGIYSAE
jgi:hypothetical protein